MDNKNLAPNDIFDKVAKKEIKIIKEDGSFDWVMGYEINVSSQDYDFKNKEYKRIKINDEIIEF